MKRLAPALLLGALPFIAVGLLLAVLARCNSVEDRGPLATSPSGVRVEGMLQETAATRVLDPSTAPTYSIVLAPGETARVMTVAQWRAIVDAFPAEQEYVAARTAVCESGFDVTAVGAAGEQGVFQILARYWGKVPTTLELQAIQAAQIVAIEGWGPWAAAGGCGEWSR